MAENQQPDFDRLTANVRAGEPGAMLELWGAVGRFVTMKANARSRLPECRVPLDDLKQAGFLAMVDAAERYDPEREHENFLSLLSYTLQKRFAEEAGIRSSKRDMLQYANSLDNAAYNDEQDGPTVGDMAEDNGACLAFVDVEYMDFITYCRRVINLALDGLTEIQAAVLRLHYFEGRTLEDAAPLCGLSSRQAASEAESRALYRLAHGKYRRELLDCLMAFDDFNDYEYAASKGSTCRYQQTWISATEAAALVKVGGMRK